MYGWLLDYWENLPTYKYLAYQSVKKNKSYLTFMQAHRLKNINIYRLQL